MADLYGNGGGPEQDKGLPISLFPEETLQSVSMLVDVLRRIDRRMKNEGFYIKNGKIVRNESS
ncbi:MAG: hypothetical protein WCK60_02790 [Candidatus Nomurabacteria bacterium]